MGCSCERGAIACEPMRDLEARLDPRLLVRIQRSTIVAIDHVHVAELRPSVQAILTRGCDRQRPRSPAPSPPAKRASDAGARLRDAPAHAQLRTAWSLDGLGVVA